MDFIKAYKNNLMKFKQAGLLNCYEIDNQKAMKNVVSAMIN